MIDFTETEYGWLGIYQDMVFHLFYEDISDTWDCYATVDDATYYHSLTHILYAKQWCKDFVEGKATMLLVEWDN